ncbi:MAG: hypothetical protein LAP85_29630 [Acidobacteriia bacterium]|nr:hypothetical protein [Terriglobia bacterium]
MKRTGINLTLLVLLTVTNSSCIDPTIGGDGRLSVVGRYRIDMAYGFDIKDNYAYLGTNDGLLVLDISKRESPAKVAELELGFIRDVGVIDGVAYLSGGTNGFIIVDISDAKQPKLLGRYRDQGEIYGFAKSGPYAYLCDRLEGLKVIDIKDPGNPKKIGQWSNGGQYWEISIRDQIAYVADMRDGLEIVEISDPTLPRLVATVPDTKGASSVHLVDEQLCLGSFNGIKTFDIKDPKAPRLVMSALGHQEVLEGYISKNLLFAGVDGVTVFDLTKPGEPIELAKWTIRGGVHGIIYDGHYIYTAKIGFYVLELKSQ